jgi:hypothetical protein
MKDNGKCFKFMVKVEGDTMTQFGLDNPYTEVWKRVTKPGSSPSTKQPHATAPVQEPIEGNTLSHTGMRRWFPFGYVIFRSLNLELVWRRIGIRT